MKFYNAYINQYLKLFNKACRARRHHAQSVDITLNNDGLGVVEQQLMRSSAKELKCRLNKLVAE
ncbi:hypothetical protein [Symbiopectobacterium purcellii]|uniref:hypothetical protein n=1 Tax=Symbiopectobacterium purcellii TaxID=2871826 RepID=UPI003F85A251